MSDLLSSISPLPSTPNKKSYMIWKGRLIRSESVEIRELFPLLSFSQIILKVEGVIYVENHIKTMPWWFGRQNYCFLIEVFVFQLGATAVNLVAGEKPADVYSGIASRWGSLTCSCFGYRYLYLKFSSAVKNDWRDNNTLKGSKSYLRSLAYICRWKVDSMW